MPRFSANLGLLWPDRPLLERIDAAAAAGFCAVELHWPFDVHPQEVAASCYRHNLKLLGINTPAGDFAEGERGFGAVDGAATRFQTSFDTALVYARESGASAIHVLAGNVAASRRARGREIFRENLQYAAALTRDDNITLLLEPLNPRDNPGYFYSRVDEAVALIETLNVENLRLQFDVYHVAITEGDVLTKLARHRDVIGNVQIAAVPTRAEPDEGEIAYHAVFDALDSLNYSGWVGCEYRPRGSTDAGLRWMQTLGVTASGL
jgi:2-dehydrotetronate isomerase